LISDKFINLIPSLLKGSLLTVELTTISVFFGLILGLLLALGRISKNRTVDRICWFYIWLFRGTPLLMQIFFI